MFLRLCAHRSGSNIDNTLAKIYSQLLLYRITKWSEKENNLLQNQFGFQKGKYTIIYISTLHTIISKPLHAGENFTVFDRI